MNTRRDLDVTIHAFLDEGLDELPERSYDAVRSTIDETRQWAVVGPWKEPQIMTATRFALIAAAVAVFAVVAIRFIPNGVGIGSPSSPTPSPLLSPSPAPVTMTVNEEPAAYGAGTYVVGAPFGVPLTFTVPDGWEANLAGPDAI